VVKKNVPEKVVIAIFVVAAHFTSKDFWASPGWQIALVAVVLFLFFADPVYDYVLRRLTRSEGKVDNNKRDRLD
jgi:hypothetical protein